MEPLVSINKNQSVDVEVAEQIDNFVDDFLIKHRDNSEMMNLVALEATSLATSVSSRSKSLEEQNLLSRFWGDLTGKNQKITSRNTRDLAQSQYLGQQMLNMLAENNLMTYQIVVALGDKVNRVVADINDTNLEIARLNANLTQFFSSMRQTLEAKFEQFERNDDLLFWKETLAFEPVYKGKTYIELTRPEKMINLANEFYHHSRQQWSSRDLAFLKSIMVSIGHHPDEKVTLKEVYQAYQCEPNLLSQLFKGIDATPELHDDEVITPTLMAFGKLQSLETNDAHIVDTIVKYSPTTSKQDICLDLTCNYIESTAGRNLDREVSFFDVVMNMVEDLVFYKQLQTTQAILANQEQLLIEQQQDEVAEQQKALALIESTKIQVERNSFTEDPYFKHFIQGNMGRLKRIKIDSYDLKNNDFIEICPSEQWLIVLGFMSNVCDEWNISLKYNHNKMKNISFYNYSSEDMDAFLVSGLTVSLDDFDGNNLDKCIILVLDPFDTLPINDGWGSSSSKFKVDYYPNMGS
ncbi:TPA: hypothetical protein ACX6RA_003753 [Photobacterium damselae]